MLSFIKTLLQAAAWPVQAPEPCSVFRIPLCAAGMPPVVFLVRCLARICLYPHGVLSICDLILAVSELHKQDFPYFVVSQDQYNWWCFPFQLCSVPMYLCPILPSFRYSSRRSTEKRVCTFMQDFALLGGVMALAELSGLMHPYLLLTLHGSLWHFMPIFIGLYCAITDLGGRTPDGLVSMLPPLLACMCTTTFINVVPHPYGNVDMFYISPYYPDGQTVFHRIALIIGTGVGNFLYLAAMVLGGFTYHLSLRRLFPRQPGRLFPQPDRLFQPDKGRLLPCPLIIPQYVPLFRSLRRQAKAASSPWSFSIWRGLSESALVWGWMVV